jgi:hypothetical protein
MRFKHIAALSASILGLSFLAGCFATEDTGAGAIKEGIHDTVKVQVQVTDTSLAYKLDSLRRLNDSLQLALIGKQDSIKNTNGNNGGWDDFPNKYRPTLKLLAANMTKLPMPMGTRYSVAPQPKPVSKAAAAAACTGLSEIAAIRYNNNDIMIVDTISYYDAQGKPHCDWQMPTTRETHARHAINNASGEMWEKIDITILDDLTLPNWITHGTGRMVLNNGEKFTVDAYDVDMIILYGDTTATVRSASLAMSWQDGYSFKLSLTKARPYKTVDLFPAWGDNPSLGKMMSGPILHPGSGPRAGMIDTAGYIDLYADHTVAIRDWTGAPVAP